jgi:hypothetical protein
VLDRPPGADDGWNALAQEQAGVVARRQLLACGLSPAQARQRIDTRHWKTVFAGVYATFTGPLSEMARVWAAVLYAGPVACASHNTALWLAGGVDRFPPTIHVAIPADRRVRAPGGVRIHLSRGYAQRQHPSAGPPRTRIEEAVLDMADDEPDLERALGIVLKATQRRLTTADRIRTALARRTRHRWRVLLTEVLAEVDLGVASPLERRYSRDVEKRHGLPPGERNRPESAPGGRRWYRDVRYAQWDTVVELDGKEADPIDQRFRDLRRDNTAVVQGEGVLRYGWRDVAGRACEVAGQVSTVLRARGWTGKPRRCGPDCALP